MHRKFQIIWDAQKLAEAFQVTIADVEEYFKDGRRVSFIIERRLKWDHPGWTLAPSEGAGYDLRDPHGGLWEVRSVTKGGVYFTPSNQVGAGRKFSEDGFQAKLLAIKGFILADIEMFPHVDVYMVPVENIIRWHRQGKLGKNAKISRSKFIDNFRHDILFD
jgi:hypothetical protein